jgi:hypothetical protein
VPNLSSASAGASSTTFSHESKTSSRATSGPPSSGIPGSAVPVWKGPGGSLPRSLQARSDSRWRTRSQRTPGSNPAPSTLTESEQTACPSAARHSRFGSGQRRRILPSYKPSIQGPLR